MTSILEDSRRYNILIPMAGKGSRFQKEGYSLPKPLIPVHGKPMIQWVIDNLRPRNLPHRFIFVCLENHLAQFGLREKLCKWAPHCEIVLAESVTQGAACTVLLAKRWINDLNPLMIANSDQWIDVDIQVYLHAMNAGDYDGFIMTMKANDPKWSYVGFDNNGNVTSVVEKEVISSEATVGVYNFRYGKDFVESAEAMISQNIRVNGEFYVAPVYNQLLSRKKKVGVWNIGKDGEGMYGLGIPSDLKEFESRAISKKVALQLTKS